MAVKDVSPETKVTRGHHLTHDQPHTSKKANSYLLCKVILVTKHYKKESTVIGNFCSSSEVITIWVSTCTLKIHVISIVLKYFAFVKSTNSLGSEPCFQLETSCVKCCHLSAIVAQFLVAAKLTIWRICSLARCDGRSSSELERDRLQDANRTFLQS